MQEEDETTPLQARLDVLGKKLGLAAVVLCIAIFVAGGSYVASRRLICSSQL